VPQASTSFVATTRFAVRIRSEFRSVACADRYWIEEPHACYKLGMAKTVERWLLFRYIHGEFTPLSKPFKTKQLAEKARLKYAERERKTIGLGVIRIES
jgi:hypothetical protein